MGLPSWLHSNVSGNIIDSVTYDEASRLTQRRASLNGQIYNQTYWPWTGSANNTNGRLKEIRLGTSGVTADRLYFLFGYDSFGNIGGMNEQYNNGTTSSFTFCYDAQNRLIRSYTPFNASLTCATHTGGRAYSYDSAGRLTNYEGAGFTVAGIRPHLALPTGGSYAVDSNGNLTNRQSHALTWNHENRLDSYYRATPYLYETYLYDVDGIRVRKTTNGVNTFYPNRFYEQSGSAITKYYYFGGKRVAMRQGHTTPLTYLYGDHVGSMAYATQQNGTFVTEQGYWGYGRYRRGGALPTDHRFTDQKLDGSGLMYYNARYFDPELGQFISPDPLVPDPTNLFDYNRYMYVRGNPMKFTDPTGHCATLDDGSRDMENDAACWKLADTIATGYWLGAPDWWSERYGSVDNFNTLAGTPGFTAEYLQGQVNNYLQQNGTAHYLQSPPELHPAPEYPPVNLPAPCEFWDCPAIAMGAASLGISIAQTGAVACTATAIGAPFCGPAAGYLTYADYGLNAVSIGYEGYNFIQGDSTTFDLSVTLADSGVKPVAEALGAGASATPGVGVAYDAVMLGYDIFIDPFVRTPGQSQVAK
ncbi:MAG: RHS repeat-associated core domain-containing protein [Caldilinea sp. CFX5]|nr:RHS repeat-associated core domain-containing protein [Caldilinea sp. CFX5]